MEMPDNLKTSLEKHILDIADIKTPQLSEAANIISGRYRAESGQGKKLIANDIEALAYSLARMPATYGAVLSALEYTLELLELSDNPIQTLLDVGAGTGAASWAADALINLKSITCVEREKTMYQLGEKLMSSGSEPLRKAKWILQDLNSTAVMPDVDLVISSYVLNEMTQADRIKMANRLWDITDCVLLIVEPGTPVCYLQLKEIRDILTDRGANIIAPCTHTNMCALSENDWCHFTCRIARTKIHRQLKNGDVPYEDEKFSYLALSKNNSRRAAARILRRPQIETGYVKLKVCTDTENSVREITVTKKNKELYKRARKAKCGDSIEL